MRTVRSRRCGGRQAEIIRAQVNPAVAGGDEAWNEESVLALDISLPAARDLAARYGQLAFLWIDRQATPRLIITAAQA